MLSSLLPRPSQRTQTRDGQLLPLEKPRVWGLQCISLSCCSGETEDWGSALRCTARPVPSSGRLDLRRTDHSGASPKTQKPTVSFPQRPQSKTRRNACQRPGGVRQAWVRPGEGWADLERNAAQAPPVTGPETSDA